MFKGSKYLSKGLIGAFMCALVVMVMVSPVMATTRRASVLEFINACQKSNKEGYMAYPVNNTVTLATLPDSYHAVKLLYDLGEIENGTYPDATRLLAFVGGLKNSTAGGFRPFTGGLESVLSTFQALWLYYTFNQSTSIDVVIHANYTLNSLNETGGFGSSPTQKGSPDVFSTYYALHILNMTGNLTDEYVNMSLVNDFLISCQTDNGMFAANPSSSDVSIMATSTVVAIYNDFLENESVNVLTGAVKTTIRDYLINSTGDDGGFFDASMGSAVRLSVSYQVVKMCMQLVLDVPSGTSSLVEWIITKQHTDGGFIEGDGSTAFVTSSMAATFHAVSTILMIDDKAAALNSQVPWDLTQYGVIIAIIIVIGGVVLLFIGLYIKMKRDQF